MAIQFFCPACHQPIEVDDDAANQSVTCPYCRKVVTAPFSTDPAVRRAGDASARMAAPPGGAGLGPSADQVAPGLLPLGPESPFGQAPAGVNVVGWISLVCGALCLISLCVAISVVMAVIRAEGLSQPAEIQEYFAEQQRSGNPPPKIMAAGMVLCLGFAAGLASLVTGIIGVISKKQPRWPAVVGLVVAACMAVVGCVGIVGQMMQAGGGGGG
jgi:hypothetical protein